MYMYHNFLIHSSASGYLGCFHVLAIVNRSTQFCSKLLSYKFTSYRGHVKTNKEMEIIPTLWRGWACFADLGTLCMDCLRNTTLLSPHLRSSFSPRHTYFWVLSPCMQCAEYMCKCLSDQQSCCPLRSVWVFGCALCPEWVQAFAKLG